MLSIILYLACQIPKLPHFHADILLVLEMVLPAGIGLVPFVLASEHAQTQTLLGLGLGLWAAALEQGPLDVLDEREPSLLEAKRAEARHLLLSQLTRVRAQGLF